MRGQVRACAVCNNIRFTHFRAFYRLFTEIDQNNPTFRFNFIFSHEYIKGLQKNVYMRRKSTYRRDSRTSLGSSTINIANRRHGPPAVFFLPRNHSETSEMLKIACTPYTYSTECRGKMRSIHSSSTARDR